MRGKTFVVLGGAAVTLAAAGWWASRPAPRVWSTRNPQALAEFEQGREAMEKLYHLDAVEHLRAALAQDGSFTAARLMLADALGSTGQGKAARAEREIALKADPKTLTPRERRIWELGKLRAEDKSDQAVALLERWAKEVPSDPEITRGLAQNALGRGDLDEATRWSEATLEVAPNDALSYNTLGYVEMGRGNFAAAEANLKRYAFIAPDQANPHDSLGELYTVMGRWEDAERELKRALEVNPRFFPAYEHLARVAALRGDDKAAVTAMQRLFEVTGAPEEQRRVYFAMLRGWSALSRGDLAALRDAGKDLPEKADSTDVLLLRVITAAVEKDLGAVQATDARAAAGYEKVPPGEKQGPARSWMKLIHAIRLLAEKKFMDAASEASQADALLTFNADRGQWIVKLIARCYQAEALAKAGQVGRAREVLASVEAVNPNFPGIRISRSVMGNP